MPEDKKLPWRVIVLDEYGDLTSDRDSKRDIEASANVLKARAAGIHLIIATQKPSAGNQHKSSVKFTSSTDIAS